MLSVNICYTVAITEIQRVSGKRKLDIMGRPSTKTDLLEAAQMNFEKLMSIAAAMSEKELLTPFDFSSDVNRKEAHWKRDKNLRDIYIHLYEWHQLLLHWVEANQSGNRQPFIPAPYNWKSIADMNIGFWNKHQTTAVADAKELLMQSHHKVLELAEAFSNEELFSKGSFDWVGGSTLGSYFVSATASHYDWAIKKLKAHSRKCKEKE